MKVILLRHGLTQGNLEKRYIGITDEPLCPQGEAALRAMGESGWRGPVYVSPLRRVVFTAKLLFPKAQMIPVSGLSEMNFGAFEGRNYQEMENYAPYREWVDGMCRGKCPGGESQAEFTQRVVSAFSDILARHAARFPGAPLLIVAHGGTIMAILDRFSLPHKDYWDWHCGPGGGYIADWDGQSLAGCSPVTGTEIVKMPED